MIFRVAKNYLNMNFNKKKKKLFLNRLATLFEIIPRLPVENHCFKGTFHFIILQTLCECYFWMFSERSETNSNI